jgi:hypothetical protein
LQAAITTDGTHLYVWNSEAQALEKIGTGLEGTIAGKIYERHGGLISAIKAAADPTLTPADGTEEQKGEVPEGMTVITRRAVTLFSAPSSNAEPASRLDAGAEVSP